MNNGNFEENEQITLEHNEENNSKPNETNELCKSSSNFLELGKNVKEDEEFDLEKFYEQRQCKIEELLNKKSEREARLNSSVRKEPSSRKENNNNMNNSKKGKSLSKDKRNLSSDKRDINKGIQSKLKDRNSSGKLKTEKKTDNGLLKKEQLTIITYQDFSRNKEDSIK
jgi:hypothetical protein